jgi:transcriptional regulator with XRE-family HTH domain
MLTSVAVGQMIEEARRRAGLTQNQLAEIVQTSQAAISRLERGKTWPNLFTLAIVFEALGHDLGLATVANPDAYFDSLKQLDPGQAAAAIEQGRSYQRGEVFFARLATTAEETKLGLANAPVEMRQSGRDFS